MHVSYFKKIVVLFSFLMYISSKSKMRTECGLARLENVERQMRSDENGFFVSNM
jgi:hypothetical protein